MCCGSNCDRVRVRCARDCLVGIECQAAVDKEGILQLVINIECLLHELDVASRRPVDDALGDGPQLVFGVLVDRRNRLDDRRVAAHDVTAPRDDLLVRVVEQAEQLAVRTCHPEATVGPVLDGRLGRAANRDVVGKQVEIPTDDPIVLEREHLLQCSSLTLLRCKQHGCCSLRRDKAAERVVVLFAE